MQFSTHSEQIIQMLSRSTLLSHHVRASLQPWRAHVGNLHRNGRIDTFNPTSSPLRRTSLRLFSSSPCIGSRSNCSLNQINSFNSLHKSVLNVHNSFSSSSRHNAQNDNDKSSSGSGGEGKDKPPPSGQPDFNSWKQDIQRIFLIAVAFYTLRSLYLSSRTPNSSGNVVSAEEFLRSIPTLANSPGDLHVVITNGTKGNVYRRMDDRQENPVLTFTIGTPENFEDRLQEAQDMLKVPLEQRMAVSYTKRTDLGTMFLNFGPTLLFVVWIVWSSRKQLSGLSGGGKNSPFQFGQSQARMYKKEANVGVKFKDVAGLPEAKQEIREFVLFLKDAERYKKLGAKIPRGALLVGPPGNGKTLLAKAAAGEANVPFFVTAGSEFLEMFVGVGPRRVRDLFKQARQNAPSIVFIDEIDAIGRSRSKGRGGGGHDERESTLNALLVEMDGFTESEEVVVMAGTNRADMLDRALTRPGRFDRIITVDNPDLKSRVEIFMVHLVPLKLSVQEMSEEEKNKLMEEYSERLSKITPGFSGADVANVCNEGALIAARHNAQCVEYKHLELAIDRVIGGMEKKRVMSKEEKEILAWHHAGQTVASWFLEHSDPSLKVSIVPRGLKPTGYAQLDSGDRFLFSKEELFDKICHSLAGRAAELLKFDEPTTASTDDLVRVTRWVYYQLTVYGMNEKVGSLSFQQSGAAWGAEGFSKPYGDKTAHTIDVEARRLVSSAFDTAKSLLEEHWTKVEQLATLLLEKESLSQPELVEVLGPRPFDKSDAVEEK